MKQILNKRFDFISGSNEHQLEKQEIVCQDQKIRRTLASDMRKHLTAFSTLLCLPSNIYRDFFL